MKKLLNKNASRTQIIISIIGIGLLFVIVGYFVITKYFLNSFAAEDYCSNRGVEVSRSGQPWEPNEVERCVEDYKRTH
ncbi:MAG TPA: hypothetical protein VLE44_01650 [Candidatus Saccharimonadales bacterium]|nr:hypothetical protein [Candidatus Saccharimonadales bacterium]